MIRSDNSATIAALNKATTRGSELMPVVREICWLCVEYDIIISGVFLAGACNILADRISRLHDLACARDACALLSVPGSRVLCKFHMSYGSYLFLQASWIGSSWTCS
jgi:hypothetical protein